MITGNPVGEAGADAPLTAEQKEYLQGFFAALGCAAPAGARAADPAVPAPDAATGPAGIPLDELTKEERIKLEGNPLDIWEKLAAHASGDKLPEGGDIFRFKYHGLFNVAPAQDALMVRLRVPAGELSAHQLEGVAAMAKDWGDGGAAITTRANLQLRGVRPRHSLDVLTRLAELGLGSRGAGADNLRNITATPTAGIDWDEILDVRPHAKALHHYTLNHRDLYGLPRKFNVAFDGGGSVSVAGDTNDIAFVATMVGPGKAAPEGIYFRVELGGITGHRQFAADTGLLVEPERAVAVAAAMIRVFAEHGDRTDRKKARLKYLLDRWGVERFLAETEGKLGYTLQRLPRSECRPRRPALRHGHVGVFRQRQPGLNYVGVAIPVGRLTAAQMRGLAALARRYGSGQARLTVWQNLLLPDIPDRAVERVKRGLLSLGLHHEATTIKGGVVACTGNAGCRFAAADTKAHALALAEYLDKRFRLEHPLNLHLTGCPHSCAQHYIADIGLLATKAVVDGESLEAYTVHVGGGTDQDQGLGREIFRAIPFRALPALLGRMLEVYGELKAPGESFLDFVRRHEVGRLQELFSGNPRG